MELWVSAFGGEPMKKLAISFIGFLIGFGQLYFDTQTWAQAIVPSHQELMKQESVIYQSLFSRLKRIQSLTRQPKPLGESLISFDISQVKVTFDTLDLLPSVATIRINFKALNDNLTQVPLLIFGPDINELEINYSRNGEAWENAQIGQINDVYFEVSLPESLNAMEQALLEYTVELDWSLVLGSPAIAFASEDLSHLITSLYIPFNGETFGFDTFSLTTEIPIESGQHPSSLGRVLSRPDNGQPGVWSYRSEIDTYILVYALGGDYPISIDGRVEIFDPPSFFGPIDHTLIAEAMTEVIPVYESLYGTFPYERLGAYPITEEAGVAVGPQAQILLPWYFWLADIEDLAEGEVNLAATIYHEIAHQYFFNSVRLNPEPAQGQAWLSEAMAEFSSIRALEELGKDWRLALWLNFYNYNSRVESSTAVPVASEAVNESPWYNEIVYLRGSLLVYGLYQRMADFTEKLRACVESWKGLFISTEDMFGCFRTMTPKDEYADFDVNQYLERYFLNTNRDQIIVEAKYTDDDRSSLFIEGHQGPDHLELYRTSALGELSKTYLPRLLEQEFNHEDSAVLVDPNITSPRVVVNTQPDDVDLNGVVDGQDALDVLFERGKRLNRLDSVFPEHLDVDQDGVISDEDITEIQRTMGQIYR